MAKPSDREASARDIVEAARGKREHYFLATGQHDFMMIITIDDVQSLLAGLMAAGAAGAVSNFQTNRAFTAAEFMDMQKKAGAIAAKYRPRG